MAHMMQKKSSASLSSENRHKKPYLVHSFYCKTCLNKSKDEDRFKWDQSPGYAPEGTYPAKMKIKIYI
jgi:hypothetical protein